MIKISGMEVQESMSVWAPILEDWCLLVERYSRAFEGEEHVFDFSERPNVGVLSAAAWRSGFLSLEEFSHGKHSGDDDYAAGRCDLWIGSHDLEYQSYVEAKHCLVSINRNEIIEGVRPRLEQAVQDAMRSAAFDEDIEGVGVCFASIYDQAGRIEDRTDHIEALVEKFKSMQEALGYDAIAWSFPGEARRADYGDETYGRLGIMLIAKRRP